jgi:hypothetical protein
VLKIMSLSRSSLVDEIATFSAQQRIRRYVEGVQTILTDSSLSASLRVIGKIKKTGTIQTFALEYNFLLHMCSPQLVE